VVQLDHSVWLLRPIGAKPESRSNRRVPKNSLGKRHTSNRDALDVRLALAAREGNHAAFAAIVNRHKEWIYRYLQRHLQNEEDASDVLQDIYLSVWRYLGRYDPERSFKVWLSQIVLNKTRDRVRRRAVQHGAQEALGRLELTCRFCAACPETHLLRDEALQRMEAAIGALQPQYKEALVLTVIENLSDSDAAAQLRIKRKVIENRVLRAKERLASLLRVSDLRSLVSAGDPTVFP
jgi:RNA polymerase sigma-70 factor (ECF subfamily)